MITILRLEVRGSEPSRVNRPGQTSKEYICRSRGGEEARLSKNKLLLECFAAPPLHPPSILLVRSLCVTRNPRVRMVPPHPPGRGSCTEATTNLLQANTVVDVILRTNFSLINTTKRLNLSRPHGSRYWKA